MVFEYARKVVQLQKFTIAIASTLTILLEKFPSTIRTAPPKCLTLCAIF